MTNTVQISSTNHGATAAKGALQNAALSASSGGQEFSILLDMLASLTLGSGTQQPASSTGILTQGQTDSQSGSQGENTSDSSTSSGSTGLASLEQQLSEILSAGSGSVKQGKTTSSALQTLLAYIAAGIPFAAQSQSPTDSQAQSDSSTTAQSATADSSSSALAQQGTESADGSLVEQALLQEAAANPAFKTDLLKLLSSASAGTSDPNVLKELNDLLSNLKSESGGAVEDVIQKLKGSTEAMTKQNAASVQTESTTSTTGTGSQQTQPLPQDLTATLVSDIKASFSAQNTTANGAPANPAGTASTTPVVAPSTDATSTGSSSNSASQATSQQGATGTIQASQIQASLPGQDGQGSSTSGDTGKQLADMMKMNAAQSYANASAGNKGNVTFQQTLSATSQNSSTTLQQPDINQLAQGIVKEAKMMMQQGKTVVNMKLEPESLGSVTLEVSSEGGKISAQFSVKTADARAYLETSVPQLKQMLETNGITLSHLSVGLSGGELQSGDAQYRYQQKRPRMRYYGNQTVAASAAAVTSQGISRSFGYNTMEMQV